MNICDIWYYRWSLCEMLINNRHCLRRFHVIVTHSSAGLIGRFLFPYQRRESQYYVVFICHVATFVTSFSDDSLDQSLWKIDSLWLILAKYYSSNVHVPPPTQSIWIFVLNLIVSPHTNVIKKKKCYGLVVVKPHPQTLHCSHDNLIGLLPYFMCRLI